MARIYVNISILSGVKGTTIMTRLKVIRELQKSVISESMGTFLHLYGENCTTDGNSIHTRLFEPCPCSPMVKPLGRHVQ